VLDRQDADNAFQTNEIIAVAGVQIEPICLRGCRDQEVGESAPRLPSFADQGRYHELLRAAAASNAIGSTIDPSS